jgi:hypothetical protein
MESTLFAFLAIFGSMLVGNASLSMCLGGIGVQTLVSASDGGSTFDIGISSHIMSCRHRRMNKTTFFLGQILFSKELSKSFHAIYIHDHFTKGEIMFILNHDKTKLVNLDFVDKIAIDKDFEDKTGNANCVYTNGGQHILFKGTPNECKDWLLNFKH